MHCNGVTNSCQRLLMRPCAERPGARLVTAPPYKGHTEPQADPLVLFYMACNRGLGGRAPARAGKGNLNSFNIDILDTKYLFSGDSLVLSNQEFVHSYYRLVASADVIFSGRRK
jgi:hypothetical protein